MPTASSTADLAYDLEWIDNPQDAAGASTGQPAARQRAADERKRAGLDVRVSRIIACGTCGWHESEAAPECFRCGAPLEADIRKDPTLQRLGIATQGVLVDCALEHTLPEAADGLSVPEYLLRIEAERLRLVQGFDDLISLELVDLDHYPYQLDACRTVLAKMRGRALLADEVGLGKTIEAGLVMKELVARGMASRVLVLTPASLVYQWREELELKFREPFVVINSPEQWEALDPLGELRVVISLDRAKGDRHARFIHDLQWDLVVIDEAHRLKNRSTQAYKFVKGIERRYMLMLTATPVHNDLTELYSLIDLLKPGQLGTLKNFREQFIKSGDARSPENAPALQKLLGDVMIRNRRTEVGVFFPKRRAAIVHVDLPELERGLYDDMTGFMRRALLGRGAEGQAAQKHTHLRLGLMTLQRELCSSPAAVAATLRQMATDDGYEAPLRSQMQELAARADDIGYAAKVDALLDVLEEYPGKFLIFTEFRKTQEDLLRALDESGISAAAFHGGLRAVDKERAVQAFRGDTRVLVSTESGGEGRNLQFCHQLVNYDLPWNPMRVEQRIGRVHRLGQQNDVVIFNLSTKDTLESYLLDLLVRKIRMFELVVGELDLILGDFDKPGETRSFEDLVMNAWLHSEDEMDLQMHIEEIGQRFERSRERYVDRRVLNEEMFELLKSTDESAAPSQPSDEVTP